MRNRRFGYEYRVYCEHLFCVFFHSTQVLDKIPFPAFRRRILESFLSISLNTRTKTNTRDEQQLFDDVVYVRFVLDEL